MQPEQKKSYLGPVLTDYNKQHHKKYQYSLFLNTNSYNSVDKLKQSFTVPAVIRRGFKHPEADNYEFWFHTYLLLQRRHSWWTQYI